MIEIFGYYGDQITILTILAIWLQSLEKVPNCKYFKQILQSS